MDKTKRTPLVAGNWKMNLNRSQTGDMIKQLRPLCSTASCDIVLCVPFTAIETAAKAMKGSELQLGAQNCHWEQKGAYTGEISAEMLIDSGVKYVIIGHSERRQHFAESDYTVNKRLKAALNAGLNCILCVGETLEQKDNEETTKVILGQLKEGLQDITAKQMEKIIIAYEPVWAIGTGKTATAQLAGEVCGFIRGILTGLFDMELSYKVRILYGGSMNAQNAMELLSQYDIDGGLIGSASLKAEDFSAIVGATSL